MMGFESASNYILNLLCNLFMIFYQLGEEFLGTMPQRYILTFDVLMLSSLPSVLMYVFVAYRKYILYMLLLGWFLFILAVILY
jgi:hypothetical protein